VKHRIAKFAVVLVVVTWIAYSLGRLEEPAHAICIFKADTEGWLCHGCGKRQDTLRAGQMHLGTSRYGTRTILRFQPEERE